MPSQNRAVIAQDQRHQDGVALFLLIPERGFSSSAATAKPAVNSKVNRVRARTVVVSGARRIEASSIPAVVMEAWEPSVSPMPTYRASQKLSNAPLRAAG